MTRVTSQACPVHKTSGAGDDPSGTLNPALEPVPNAIVDGEWVHIYFPVDP